MNGTVWKFGDDIDTDIILPGRYLIYTDEERLSQHCMEGLDPNFNEKCKKGDFIVAGKNFGCGSSREHAPIALKGVGVSAVIAESFARIFYRNATNVGVPLLEAPGITKLVENEEKIEVVTILQKNEYQLLLEYIHKTDDRAFVTVTSIGEVLGKWNVHRRKKIEIQ